MYRLDRKSFTIQSFEESTKNSTSYWKSKKPEERLQAAWYLTCSAFDLAYDFNIRMDRSVFSCGKKEE
ncbi:MAG: hypothetical protein ACI8VT_001315 [Saprospiraceae bacterium]|jgi:hypothetical protein